MPYQIRSPYGWEDLPPGAVMDEDTLSRLLQLGLVRWRNPNIFVMLIGCVGYAFVIGSIGTFLDNFNRAKRAKTKMLKQVR